MASKTFWLTSAAAAAFLIGAPVVGQVAASPIPPAATYADLLEPVPNAGARLVEDDKAQMQVAHLELAQYNMPTAHHHHHHHHSARWYRSNGYRWSGGTWVLLPKVHHHHHHSRQWYSDNGYFWNGRAWVLRGHHHHHHQAQ